MKFSKLPSIFPMVRNLGLLFAGIIAVVFSVYAGNFPAKSTPYITALSSDYYYEQGKNMVSALPDKMPGSALKNILKTEIPALSIADDQENRPVGSKIMLLALNILSGVNLEDPLTYFKAEIPMMDVTPVTADSLDETGFDEVTEPPATPPPTAQNKPETVKNTISSEKPLIALYNTHTSETFELTDGVAHKKAGEAGGVATVAKEIQKTIQDKYNIAVTYSPKIHDASFNKSYAESEKTVKEFLKEYPGLQLLFDIHRDGALSREQSLVSINGKKVAKILIVVGTNARAYHPKWRENLELARKLSNKINELYPGLCRGITVKQGRYNQHLSTHALLVEIGSAKNSTDEAVATGRMFADAVVALLNDLQNKK